MAYSMLKVLPRSGRGFVTDLNQVDRGWVAQILNGSFGANKEYNFTGNVVTTVTDKPIDINVRLTPTVPIPERPPRYFLDALASSSDLTVQITDDSVKAPSIGYKFNETTTYTPPTVTFDRKVVWKQDCVIREIKYDYSANPATIDFTITTKNPVLYGPEFPIRVGLGNQNWGQALNDVQKILDKLYIDLGYFDINTLQIGLPPVGTNGYQIFKSGLTQFHAFVNGSSSTEKGFFEMTRSETGSRVFSITGGYQPLSSTCYASEAYPAITPPDISSFLKNLNPPPVKFALPNIGNAYVAMNLVMIRKGL